MQQFGGPQVGRQQVGQGGVAGGRQQGPAADATHRQPLIASSPSDAGEPDKTPSKNNGESTSPVAGPRQSAAAAAADADVVDDDVPTTSDVTASLIGNASSHASLDSYDRTKNPFFAN